MESANAHYIVNRFNASAMAANLQMIEESMYIEESIEIVESTEGVLLNLVRRLSTDQLLALPPLVVPPAVLDRIGDSARREALQRLDELARASTDRGRATAPSQAEREAALVAAEQADPADISALRERIERIKAASRASRFDNSVAAEMSEDLESLRTLAADAGAALAGLSSVETTLAQAQWVGDDQRARANAAQSSVARLTADLRAALEDYHRLEITLLLQAMRGRYADCELEARRFRDLSDQAEAIRARLHRPARALGWLLLRPGPSRDERQRLQRRLRRLNDRLNCSCTFVEESEVRQWLDRLVDAGLELTPEQWHSETQEVRFLFYQLLNINRLQGIMPARRLVPTIFMRDEAHDPPKRCVAGERYLVTWFTGRGAAPRDGERWEETDGSDGIASVRATMFTEYRNRTPSG